jgi:hypothetical protein
VHWEQARLKRYVMHKAVTELNAVEVTGKRKQSESDSLHLYFIQFDPFSTLFFLRCDFVRRCI